jgi:hypothetical protein
LKDLSFIKLVYLPTKGAKNSPKPRGGSIHRGMSELGIRQRPILTGEIFSTVKNPLKTGGFID